MTISRMIPILSLIWIVAIGCSNNPEYYTNPYDDPRSQMEYNQWTMEDKEKKMRADQFFKNENTWIQTYDQREPVFRGYMEDVNQTNQRLQRVRVKEESTRIRNFQESIGVFSTVQERKNSRTRSIKDKQTDFFFKKQISDKERYDEYLRLLNEKRKLLQLKKRRFNSN